MIYANRALQADPARLKFDLAAHIAHKVLHGGDGMKSPHATGGEMGGSPESGSSAVGMSAQDVLHAWRDFECSFFAGALLAPRVPFRRFLARERYRVEAGAKLELTPAVIMRRMTKVSPYPYWHFFDAYPPGYLRAVYRGNGIPLPWGNLAQVSDPCPHWAVFRMIDSQVGARLADLRAARWRALAAVLLPFDARARHGGQSARAVGRGRPGAGAGHQRRGQRGGRRFDLPRVPAPPRRGAHPQGAPRRCWRPSPTCSTSPGSTMRWRSRRASSARAATAARAPSAARARGPRGRARSPTCARRSSGATADARKIPTDATDRGAQCLSQPQHRRALSGRRAGSGAAGHSRGHARPSSPRAALGAEQAEMAPVARRTPASAHQRHRLAEPRGAAVAQGRGQQLRPRRTPTRWCSTTPRSPSRPGPSGCKGRRCASSRGPDCGHHSPR